ncbi:nucleotidyltransferase [Pontiella sulfatireligans]|nr:nucleotidyltransferase [Pontiella sulfatireligans]
MKELVELFNKHGVDFAVCGGFAVAHYGFVRMTMDFDLLVLPTAANAARIMMALTEFGFGNAGFSEKDFQSQGTAVTLGEQPNQIDLLTSMSSQSTADILDQAASVQMEGMNMKVVGYKDLLAAKQEAGRVKDKLDVEELKKIKGQGGEL